MCAQAQQAEQSESIFTTRILENEFRITTLESLVEIIISKNPQLKIEAPDLQAARDKAINLLQEKYPDAGLTLK